MMHRFVHFILIEGLLAHRLLTDGAIGAPAGILFYEVKNKSAFAEMYIFVVHVGRSPAPGIPATERTADESRITAVGIANKNVVATHREMIIHQEIGSGGIA